MKPPLHIAIDGPVAAGKGTIAGLLARKLGILNLYTGGMYRALAYSCYQNQISWNDKQKVLAHLKKIQIKLVTDNSNFGCRILLNGNDITREIATTKFGEGASIVSVYPKVRQIMVKLQQYMAKSASVVAEGRDIGLRVLPDAQIKIYLTASLKERAKRRWLQIKTSGSKKSYPAVRSDVHDRDTRDLARETDPLQKLPDAWELDTTYLTPPKVVEKIMAELKQRQLL